MTGRRLVRSYQEACNFEAKLNGFGDLQFPRPLPTRAVAYGLALELVQFLVARLPLIGAPIRALGWELRWLLVPLALAWLLSVAQIGGRRFHIALLAWGRHWLSPRQLAGGWRPVHRPGELWTPEPIVLIGDGRHGRPLGRLELRGPGRVLLRYPCRARQHGATLHVEQSSHTPCFPGKVIEIPAGGTVTFNPSPRSQQAKRER